MTSALRGKRILVIEDEAILAMDIDLALSEAGAEIVGPAATIGHALQLADGPGIVSAAILDLRLQGELAYPVAQRLSDRGIPFLFYSGQVDCEAAATWPHIPVLSKPAPLDAIIKAVAALAAASAPSAETRQPVLG